MSFTVWVGNVVYYVLWGMGRQCGLLCPLGHDRQCGLLPSKQGYAMWFTKSSAVPMSVVYLLSFFVFSSLFFFFIRKKCGFDCQVHWCSGISRVQPRGQVVWIKD